MKRYYICVVYSAAICSVISCADVTQDTEPMFETYSLGWWIGISIFSILLLFWIIIPLIQIFLSRTRWLWDRLVEEKIARDYLSSKKLMMNTDTTDWVRSGDIKCPHCGMSFEISYGSYSSRDKSAACSSCLERVNF